ncbi:SdrD B-like domain-containing protein [Arthrobacter citreus]|uniref:SdrD B-like domain-containing protein n=1 Tax=Arthrobacter citreus TaxID=1670 RepID=UPI0036DDFF47
MLAITIAATDVVTTSDLAAANTGESPSITLNGTVVEGAPGYLTSKSIIMTSAQEARLNYRLVPSYSTGATSKVTVTLFMPSLEQDGNGGWKIVDRDAAPTAMGLQGRVSAGGGWATPNGTVSQGGKIVLEYIGDLEAGVNPAFDLFLSTYNDGTDGPFGGVPEGTAFDVHGYVTYEQYNGEGEGWETLGRDDVDSHVQVIATDLQWEPQFTAFAANGGSTAVPMWDRFQYFDYIYKLQNTSTNPASNIEAYSVNFDIDTTDNINGIIPADINRWSYNPGGEPTYNDDADFTDGQFIGVPGKGGVLIYDITDIYSPTWDGATGLGDPLPYIYTGAGMITLDRQSGENRQQVKPGTERIYMVSLPMSLQGFPNIPTNFYVDAITNIVLGESTNWTKTKTAVREVMNPTYGFDFTHKAEKSEAVYASDTYTELSDFKNNSNAPVFNPSIQYTSVDKFNLSDVVYLFDEADAERFKDATLSYSFKNERGQTINRNLKATPVADPLNPGKMKAVFDVSELKGKTWDKNLNFAGFAGRINPGDTVPFTVQVHGTAMEVKTMTFPAVTTYVEKYANNEDYTQPTTYAEIPHTVQRDASFRVVMPKEVLPQTLVGINGNTGTTAQYPQTVNWNQDTTLGFSFGTNGEIAETSETTITVNTKTANVVKDARMVINPELFTRGENVRIKIISIDGEETVVDLEGKNLTEAIEVKLPADFGKIMVETDQFSTANARNFIDVIGKLDNGLNTTHTVSVNTKTSQGEPYNKTNTSASTGHITIQLPNVLSLATAVTVNGSNTGPHINNHKVVKYEDVSTLGFFFGTNNITSETTDTTITVNTADKEVVKDAKMLIRPELFAQAKDVVIKVVTLDGTVTVVDLTDKDLTQPIEIELPEKFAKIIVETGTFKSNGAVNYIDVIGAISNDLVTTHTVNVAMNGFQTKPYDQKRSSSSTGHIAIQLPADLNPSTSIVGIYGERRTSDPTYIPYEVPVSAEYRLSTGGVNAPEFTYTIIEAAPSKMPAKPTDSSGILIDNKLTLSEEFLAAGTDFIITFVDDEGEEQSFTTAIVDYKDITLDNIAKIVISGKNLKLDTATPIVTIDYDSELDMGASQRVNAKFEGTPQKPFVNNKTATASHLFEVTETRTTVDLEGVNQVTKGQGAGNAYDQWVDRDRSCGNWCTMTDYTLDQGYKTLGGFASTIHRPGTVNNNNDQTTVLDVNLPHEQFDMYYMKIRKDLQPYIQSVDIYRMVDGEEVLWRTVPGTDWVNNTTEGTFWRINSANQDVAETDMFTSKASTEDADHPYYKAPFADNVVPDQPVSRVSVTLKFDRKDAASVPDLSGTTSRVIEYMGRFFETSEEAKKATTSTVEDTFGKKDPITRSHTAVPVYSLVHYPFAQTETGAQDAVSLQRKVVMIGTEGNYLASVWNIANQNYGPWQWPHGGDLNVPVHTESDEWLWSYDPEAFHDKLAYKFTYPATPDKDADFNLDPTHITFDGTSTLQYLTGLSIATADNGSVELALDAAERAEILTHGSFVVKYNGEKAVGFHKISAGLYEVSLGEGVYPTSFEAVFEEINGFGDNTAELQGATKDSLGANLNEIDVRIGGIVNGNQDLVGTTQLFREPNDSARTLMSTSTGVLVGYTPTLGATMDMSFDKMSLYDYGTDGVTPNTTKVEAGMTNNAESDITAFKMALNVDPSFRAREIRIPASVFDGEWKATSVTIGQTGSAAVVIDRDLFELDGTDYVLNVDQLIKDGVLKEDERKVKAGGESTLSVRSITNVTVNFESTKDDVRMWGSLSQPATGDKLPTRMIPGSYISIMGDWVDEALDADGNYTNDWDSEPSFRGDGERVNSGSIKTTSFSTSASNFATNRKFTTPAALNGNAGVVPTLTRTGDTNNNTNLRAPVVRHRTADMQFHGVHLNEDLTLASKDFPYDADTLAQVAANDLVVGDTTKVLYEIRNSAALDAEHRNPLFDPTARFTSSTGLNIIGVTVVTSDTDEKIHNLITELGRTAVLPTDDQFVMLGEGVSDKAATLTFQDFVLKPQESVFVLVEYEAVNDFVPTGLEKTQGKAASLNATASTGHQHHMENVHAISVAANGVNRALLNSTNNGSYVDYNGDGFDEFNVGLGAGYTYANPSVVGIDTTFDEETLSGTPMTITIDDLVNHIRHSNTNMVVDVTLDTRARGFVLSEVPNPTTLDGLDAPKVYGLIGDEWEILDADKHDLSEVNKVRVDYGIVPAFAADGSALRIPAFEIHGTGWWQNYGGTGTKSSTITSLVELDLMHHDGSTAGNPAVALYEASKNDSVTIYKALPQVEFNLQSFGTFDEAKLPYDNTKLGKTSYVAGEAVSFKLTARNANTSPDVRDSGLGKAPVLEPIIYDKLPEYVVAELQQHISNGVLDVEAAVKAGRLEIKHYDAQNAEIENLELPTVTVEAITGKDVAGKQKFSGIAVQRSGKISSAEPNNTDVNPAADVNYQLFTYEFADDLGRGERIEVSYPAKIRDENLPVATYKDGRSVFAPMLGWYGNDDFTSAGAHAYDMDMAALLHDAGFTGTRSFEQTKSEFLASSSSWVPGQTRERRVQDGRSETHDTYYDASANSQYVHRVYLGEEEANSLRLSNIGEVDDNFKFVIGARVNDGQVKHDDRVIWSQDNMQLSRAWLYGASELLPAVERTTAYGASNANFIEHDGSLAKYDRRSEFISDDYTYAVELGEQVTVRLHAANLGDRAINSGISYTEVLPVGFNPFDEDGNLIGITAVDGFGNSIGYTYEVLQTPADDNGYRAPYQNQEAGTYKDLTEENTTVEDAVPYVIRIDVAGELNGMFKSATSTLQAKYQHVDLKVRVDEQATVPTGDHRYWFDQLTVTTIDPEEYLALYSKEYGAVDYGPNDSNQYIWPNDGIYEGIDLTDLNWWHPGNSNVSGYTSYSSLEPYGMYIRGLNAQATITELDGKPALVTGDQMVASKPTLRVWNDISKDEYVSGYAHTVQDFTTELHDKLTIHAHVENQQIEAQSAYHNAASSGWLNGNLNQPQTKGGARGTWFDPTVTISLPYGVVPILEDGSIARYAGKIVDQQDVAFTATVNNVTYGSSTAVVQDADAGTTNVAEHLDLRVERIQSEHGERFVLFFTMKDTDEARAALSRIEYGQSLTVSPRAMVVDMPQYTNNETLEDEKKFQQILTFANSEVDIFEPIVSGEYPTGSSPQSPAAVDQYRLDTMGTNGVNKITERLISATQKFKQDTGVAMHTSGAWTVPGASLLADQVQESESNYGAFGGTRLAMRFPSLYNTTTIGQFPGEANAELQALGAAGKFWVATDAHNNPDTTGTDYSKMLTTGIVHNSRFIFTSYVTSFAEKTGDVRIKVGNEILDRAAFEARGYTVKAVTKDERLENTSDRQVVRWVVTPPAPNAETAAGRLDSGARFSLIQEYKLVDGFREDEPTAGTWVSENFKIDTYVSLISDDHTLLPEGGNKDDFVVQPLEPIRYSTAVTETATTGDIDGNGNGIVGSFLAQDQVRIQTGKPQGEIRVNTIRPRMTYTNNAIGDPYFNTVETIEYLVTMAKLTGSSVRELVVENNLPAHESNDPKHPITKDPIDTNLMYVSSGKWEIPASVVAHIERSGKTVDQVFETEVFISTGLAETGYEAGEWVSLGKQSVLDNKVLGIPAELEPGEQRKVRVVVRSIDENYLVPAGTRLAIDADSAKPGNQEVTETDPENKNVTIFGKGVTDAAIKIGMRGHSQKKQTMFIYDTAELWGNYTADAMANLDDSSVRAYLTPSRPVVNVFHDALYYRYDGAKPEDQRWGWSDNMAINPSSSSHLKFRGEVVNADDTMWNKEESITYSEDMLIDPKVTFELPRVMTVRGEDDWVYVPADEVDETSPLNDAHRSKGPLQKNATSNRESDAFKWTWKIVAADGTVKQSESNLTHTRIHAGEWDGMDRNVVTIWFEGQVLPGDKIVIDFIGLIDTYTPGATSEDTKSWVYTTNNTGLVQPLNSDWNGSNTLGYETDRNDLDDNSLRNDRLVSTDRILFEYEVYDNFGKRKVAYSDLNLAGTAHPRITPVREGGDFNYTLTIDNTKEKGETPYPFPIIYDVLPYDGDHAVMNESVARNSHGSSILNLDSFKLTAEGGLNKTYGARDYTMYVGPFTKQGGKVVEAELLPASVVSTQEFYDSMGVGGAASAERDKHFVSLADFKAAVAADPSLLGKAQSLLMLFNNAGETLPGQSKLTLSYGMSTPLNAPAFLEAWDTGAKPDGVAQWNSFAATQLKENFKPQESNNAGTFVTEKADKVSIGNYVWHDANFDAEQNEGEIVTDVNGRELLKPAKDIDFDGDIDDAGINQVKVTLLSPNGYNVDYLGNPIKKVGNQWLVIDDATGEVFVDEIGQKMESDGPVVTTTRTDINGWNGYYVFSNITPGKYRVMFEMPKAYDGYSVTTQKMISGADVATFLPGEAADVQVAHDVSALVAVTDVRTVTQETADDTRMGFDLGVGHLFDFGGTVWNDKNRDGVMQSGEDRLPNFKVTLKNAKGETVLDENGDEMTTVSDAKGQYTFPVLARPGQFYVEVVHPDGTYDKKLPVTPITHAENPFTRVDDNDVTLREVGNGLIVRTNLFAFDLENLYETKFADRQAVNAGFYDYRNTGVIGNLVWDDKNRNGIQEPGEPGLDGQELKLEQYELVDGKWVKNDGFVMTTTSQADGLYYFNEVPAFAGDAETGTAYAYQVIVDGLPAGYTFAPSREGDDREVDSDFFLNGAMNEKGGLDNLITLAVQDGQFLRAVDNVTIDLGVMEHATGVIAGEAFIDTKADGQKVGDGLAAERFTATLQVSTNGAAWTDVAAQTGVNKYRFEGLPIYNDAAGAANQYRVVVTEIPLWLAITKHNQGADETDSDFVETGRNGTFTAVSDVYTLARPVEGQILPVDTREALTHDDVDLGLVEPGVVIGGKMWDDANANGLREEGEKVLAGHTVVLWELVDGAWVKAGDSKDVTDMTDENGDYRFVVEPMHFDESSPEFMQAREYRVTIERLGNQLWSPVNVGGDKLIDSDVITEAAEFGGAHTGVSHVFSIIEHVNGVADPLTQRDDVQMDAGLTIYADRAVIGGSIWVDKNEDGIQQDSEGTLGGREVTLLEKIDGEWIVVADLNGNYTIKTEADGSYEFVVEPTHWGEDHDGYLKPREYRTETHTPVSHRLSLGDAVTASDRGNGWIESKVAELVEVDEETGLIVLAEEHEDRELDYPFAVIPLAFTGGKGFALLLLGALGAGGLGILLLAAARRRMKEEEEMQEERV